MFKGTLRKLKPTDIESVEKIFDLYWTDDFREHLSTRLRETNSDLTWFVAEENGEVVGVAAYRKAPERMKQYAKTDHVVEFYVAAVKEQHRGIGTALLASRLKDVKEEGYEEAIFFGGESHRDSWNFHDNSGFERVGEATAPNGEKGYIWLMKLK